ncbi:hypothetical protein CLD22_14420 [Rubrivivax gelatinosus]|nr:hypothetical protein [Rubrivivax gelatinosus]
MSPRLALPVLALAAALACAPAAAAGRAEARAAAEQRDWAQALPLYAQLVAAHGDDVDLLIEAARVNGFADRNAEAAALYRRALVLAPARRADILPSLAWQSLWSGQADQAQALFTELLPGTEGAARAALLDGQGQVRQALGDAPGAAAAFAAALALAPEDARLQRRLATALLWSGDEAGAVRELEALARRFPADRDIAWALANARNFAGASRAALAGFRALPAPVHPGERADLARAWWWAGYEDRAWPLLAEPADADSAWLRDWRIGRELRPFGYATFEASEDKDELDARAWTVGGGWHPAPGATVDLQARRLTLDDANGDPAANQFAASLRWRLGEPDSAWGTWWPSVALRSASFGGWNPVLPTLRLVGVPADHWRVDTQVSRELVEAPRAVANRVTLESLALGLDHRPTGPWSYAGSGALQRFDDGTTRLRLRARVERTLPPRGLSAGFEASAIERSTGDDDVDRGYWNPDRYREARAYLSLAREWRPLDLQLRAGLGIAHETDTAGNRSTAHPNFWELALGWDLDPSVRLRLAMGGSGQRMATGDSASGYWRRYLTLALEVWR